MMSEFEKTNYGDTGKFLREREQAGLIKFCPLCWKKGKKVYIGLDVEVCPDCAHEQYMLNMAKKNLGIEK